MARARPAGADGTRAVALELVSKGAFELPPPPLYPSPPFRQRMAGSAVGWPNNIYISILPLAVIKSWASARLEFLTRPRARRPSGRQAPRMALLGAKLHGRSYVAGGLIQMCTKWAQEGTCLPKLGK